MEKNKSEEFYKRLRAQLIDDTDWPSNYLYKFIVPTDKEKIEGINKIFDKTGAVIESKLSNKGTYTSISVMVHLSGPDEVIEKYIEVSAIEGVISL